MAGLVPQQQILLRLVAITACDVALVAWLVGSAIRDGRFPDNGDLRRDARPSGFWTAIILVVLAGIAFAAGLAYAVLQP